MTSFPARSLEIWKSSLAHELTNISGVFALDIVPTLMVAQTLEFLAERAHSAINASDNMRRFFKGMDYWSADRPNVLYYWYSFDSADELFNFDFSLIRSAVQELELHTDNNLLFDRFTFFADVGGGPRLPLLQVNRRPFPRSMSFEIEERGTATASIEGGTLKMTERAQAAHQHYSTAMTLLAAEDSLAGLIDAAYVQFYLSTEAILDKHEKKQALLEDQRVLAVTSRVVLPLL